MILSLHKLLVIYSNCYPHIVFRHERQELMSASITSRSLRADSGPKRFLSKLLHKKSRESPASSGSSTKHSVSSAEASEDQGNKKRLSLSSQTPRSMDSQGTYIDDDDSSIFNHESDEEGGVLLGNNSEVFSTSLLDEDNAMLFAHDEKIAFPTDVPDEEDKLPWSGLTYEALIFPKFVRTTKRSKRSPRMLNNMFLAQELHCADVESPASSDVESDVEKNSDRESITTENTSSMNKNKLLVMEFSRDGKYLAVAGHDGRITVWQVISSPLSRLQYKNYAASEVKDKKSKMYMSAPVFHQEPVRVFEGHGKTVLALDWSKNNFLVSGSMDRTAKLWNVERAECLETFKHHDFVTAVKFHPTDDRFFVSGSLDNNVRLWSILENSVAFTRDLGDDVLITALAMTPTGSHTVVGGFNGSLFALETQGLHLLDRAEVKERFLAQPFHRKNGNTITGIRVFENTAAVDVPSSSLAKWNLLVTTNDSRIRLIDMRQKKLVTRFRGASNSSSSIVASLSEDNRYVISGSEDHCCYVWENSNTIINNKLRIAMKDFYVEGKHHMNDTHKKVTELLHDNKLWKKLSLHKFLEDGNGQTYIANENNSYSCFHAHHAKVNAAIFAPENTKTLLEFSDDIIFDLVSRVPLLEKYGLSPRRKNITFPEESGMNKGHIIVTGDQLGVIRVFRQDSAYGVRKALVDMRKSSKCMSSLSPADSREVMSVSCRSKIDLSGINMKLMKTRSLSPSLDYSSSLRGKLSKLKPPRSANNSTFSSVVSGIPPGEITPGPLNLKSVKSFHNMPVLTSSSQMSLKDPKGFPRGKELTANYVTIPTVHDHEDTRSYSDESNIQGTNTPRSLSAVPVKRTGSSSSITETKISNA